MKGFNKGKSRFDDADTDEVEDEDFLPLTKSPKTVSEFLYHIVWIPFLTGIAQGVGSVFGSWFVRRASLWWRNWGNNTSKVVLGNHVDKIYVIDNAVNTGEKLVH